MLLNELVLVVGIIGSLVFSLAAFFNWKVYKRLKESKEQTLEYFFLRDQILVWMKALVLANVIFVVGVIFSLIGIWRGIDILIGSVMVASAVLIVAHMGFFLALFIYTHPKGMERFR